ncbi:hypothetical protein U1Q18_005399 [Sarracenia purpurea var. burkii]
MKLVQSMRLVSCKELANLLFSDNGAAAANPFQMNNVCFLNRVAEATHGDTEGYALERFATECLCKMELLNFLMELLKKFQMEAASDQVRAVYCFAVMAFMLMFVQCALLLALLWFLVHLVADMAICDAPSLDVMCKLIIGMDATMVVDFY